MICQGLFHLFSIPHLLVVEELRFYFIVKFNRSAVLKYMKYFFSEWINDCTKSYCLGVKSRYKSSGLDEEVFISDFIQSMTGWR